MGLFDKFKDGLKKTRDFIGDTFNSIAAAFGVFNEEEIDELEMLMIASDMGVNTTDKVISNLKAEMKAKANNKSDFVLRTLKNNLSEILGEKESLKIEDDKLNIIIMVGVNGTGKTTSAAKLAYRYQNEGKSVLMCAADTFRAAAIEQLEEWTRRTNTPLISQKEGNDPAAVVYDAISSAKARNSDILIVDTAGRLHNQKNLMDELAKIRRVVDREAPEANVETLLVIDATSGQNAVIQANIFKEIVDVSGLIITKLDGSAKGGVVIAVSDIVKTPIYFAGLGEQAEDLVEFDPNFFIDSLLPDDWIQNS